MEVEKFDKPNEVLARLEESCAWRRATSEKRTEKRKKYLKNKIDVRWTGKSLPTKHDF